MTDSYNALYLCSTSAIFVIFRIKKNSMTVLKTKFCNGNNYFNTDFAKYVRDIWKILFRVLSEV